MKRILQASAFLTLMASASWTFSSSVRPLILPAGGDDSDPSGINNDGQIVGDINSAAEGAARGVVEWNSNGKPQQQTVGGAAAFQATDITDAGMIYGVATADAQSSHYYSAALVGGKVVPLDGPSAQYNSSLKSVSSNGYATEDRFTNNATTSTAVILRNGKATALTQSGATSSLAGSVDSRGEAIVSQQRTNGSWSSPMIWSNGGLHPLGVGDTETVRQAVLSDAGDLAFTESDSSYGNPVLVRIDNGKTIKIPVPPDFQGLNLTAMNDRGQVIGVVYNDSQSDAPSRAFVADSGGFHFLTDLVSKNSGWDFQFAADINDKGEIVGRGVYKGSAQPFALQTSTQAIPLPAPVMMGITTMPLVALGIYGARRRSHA